MEEPAKSGSHEERQAGDRRRGQRRDPRWRFDPMFAATLVNQLAAPEAVSTSVYPERPRSRAGLFINVKV
jgi:hypothetical protein